MEVDMMRYISKHEIDPKPQAGEVVEFKRRTPRESAIPTETSLEALFNHIRMLDAEEYPPAFLELGNLRFEFSRPALRTGRIEADVRITGREDS